MQGASYFSRANQHARITQFEELAKTLAEQVAFSLSTYIDDSSKDNVNPLIMANLNHLTHDSRVLDASLYLEDGTQIAHSGENVTVKERLALEGQKVAVLLIINLLCLYRAKINLKVFKAYAGYSSACH
nr:Protein Smp [Proteus terrae subsp. cibarius]